MSDKDDLSVFEPKDDKNRRANPYNTQRPLASEGTMNRFISEQSSLSHLNTGRKRYWKNSGWFSKTWQLRNGKPIMWGDKFINPPKLDISNLNKKKDDEE